jgi:hypothetical protein
VTGTYHCAQLLVKVVSPELFPWAGLEQRSSQSQPPKKLGI